MLPLIGHRPRHTGGPWALIAARWIHWCLALAAGVSWGAFVWLTTHRSLTPVYLDRYSGRFVAVLGASLAVALVLTWLQARPEAVLRHARHVAILGVISPVLALGSIEAAMRYGNFLGASFYLDVERYMRLLEPHDTLVYRHRPGLRATFGGVEVAFNELGFRERPIGPRPPGHIRIVVLGDSVTLGWGVPAERTYARRLEDLLRHRGIPAETINTGVNGYNTEHQLQTLRVHGERLRPDAMVLLYVENDIEPTAPLQLPPEGPVADWRDPLEAGASVVRQTVLYRFYRHVFPGLLRARSRALDSEGVRRSMAALAEISAECRRLGAPLAVYLYRIHEAQHTDTLRAEIAHAAGRHGFAFHDTVARFDGHPPHEITNSIVDTHPNALGHEILARGMAASLQPLLPASSLGSREEAFASKVAPEGDNEDQDQRTHAVKHR